MDGRLVLPGEPLAREGGGHRTVAAVPLPLPLQSKAGAPGTRHRILGKREEILAWNPRVPAQSSALVGSRSPRPGVD